ncbi:MAG: TssN family type VI secretion system protein [Chitinophagaceae bacterium]
MERVISSEITKYLIVLGAGVIGLSVVLARLITGVRGAFKPYQKATMWYALVAVLFFALIALAAYPGFISKPMTAFMCFQAYFLLLGSAHLFYMRQNLRWTGDDKAFYAELVFTLLLAVFGSICFLLLYHTLNGNGLEYMMAASILFFIIPFFFYYTFQKATGIPPKVLKEWFYPYQQEMAEPEESKLKNLLVISFEFQKQVTDQRITNFRAKAPVDMEMGELFYYFINDYNERHPNGKIQFTNTKGEPNGWIFYKKPKWYSLMTSYVDAEKTIFNNNIKENDVIICSRSLI